MLPDRRERSRPSRLFSILALGAIACFAQAATLRTRTRFDEGWRFRRDPETTRNATGPFVWQWQPSAADSLDAVPHPQGAWRPYRIGENTLKGAVRFGLFRTDLGRGPLAGRVLHFESVDDNAAVYLNGRKLFRWVGYSVPFDVPVADVWNENGPNELTVLVENTGGEGGINGAVVLERHDRGVEAFPEVAPAFDDRAWRTVHLPHDYVVEGTFKASEETGHGSLPRPTAWYRKRFAAPKAWKGKSVWIDFDGVYRNADVYLNGRKLGHENSGYIGFRFDLSKFLNYGGTNVLAVRTDPRKDEGWWYEGGGIYRHVWMNVADPVHVVPDGVFVRATPSASAPQTSPASLSVSTEVANEGPTAQRVTVRSRWIAPDGVTASVVETPATVLGGATLVVRQTSTIARPTLWSLERPKLYRLETTILKGGTAADALRTAFGVRSIRFDKDRGFFLNGQPVKLKGTCNHQDHAGVGIAMPDGLMEWRLRRLKAMGSNAYRCSHNPPAAELLDACDRMGILVMDETRHLGDSVQPKSPKGTPADALSELKAMVRRDRNHPSVILWSLFNEEPLQGTVEGGEIFLKMRRVCDALDGTRPCSGAANYGYDAGIVDVTDVFGFNYNIGAYEGVRRRRPGIALFGSETASTVSTRGEYVNDPAKGYVSAYDVNYPGWAATAEAAWKPIADRPWMAGAFVWTGFDYKGEPTPYGWPCINSHFGILDIAGFPKDNFYYYRAVWGDTPLVHLLPHWNWKGKEGQPIAVWAHSNADSVELFLNGKSLGRKDVPHLGHVEWSVPYAPGTLEAIGYKGEQAIARDRIETTGAPVALRLKTDRTKILGDHEDLSVVQVEVVDAQGRVVPEASDEVTFAVTGAASNGGVGNGDPSDHDPDKSSRRRAFHGLAMVLVQSNGKGGAIRVTASAPGLRSASLSLSALPSEEK